MERKRAKIIFAIVFLLIFSLCTGKSGERPEQSTGLSGIVTIDGSSTVFPITQAIAEEFQIANPGIKVTVGISGTGGGFKKFCNGEVDINDASRPIRESEIEACEKNGISFIELPVAFDGIAVVANPANDWVSCLKVSELREIWKPGSKVKKWSDIRQGFPEGEIKLVGPGTDSGTFDYFTKAIVGEEHSQRSDYLASEDDNVLVQAVANEKYALGYFGYAYYAENKDKLKLIAVDDENPDNGNACVYPSEETISNGLYQPLSRPLFIYINRESADKPEVKAFVRFYLENAAKLVPEVGYVALPQKAYQLALKRFEERKTGSIFSGGSEVGVSIEEILEKES